MSRLYRVLFISFLHILLILKAHSQLIPQTIKIAIIQPFSVNSSTGSSRYNSNFESAVYYALGKNEGKINKCGAKYLVDFKYFSSDSLIEAGELAKSIDQLDYWFVIGPTRAQHYLPIVNNIKAIPIIALNSSIEGTSQKNFSTSKSVEALANRLAKKMSADGHIKNYGALVDATCPECIAFEKYFTKAITKHSIPQLFKIESEDFEYKTDLSDLFENINRYKDVDALLIPNYSKLSGYVMSQIHPRYPKIIFFGGDGWGQGEWSYLPQFKLATSINAYSAKSHLTFNKSINSLDIISGSKVISPSDLSLSAIYLFEKITNLVCQKQITSRSDFIRVIESQNNDFLNREAEISIYELHNGRLKLEG